MPIIRTIDRIDHGGFGDVDKVTVDGRYCARKTYNPHTVNDTEALRKRFRREVRVQQGLKHPNIMPIQHADLSADPPYFCMPLADTSLEALMTRAGGAALKDWEMWLDVLSGVEEIHRMGYVHRDVKPQNILQLEGRWVVADFGLVLDPGGETSRLTSTGIGFASPPYSAPELVTDFKNVTLEADIYSLGCILWRMLNPGVSRLAYQMATMAGPFGEVTAKATEHYPSDRFESISEFRQALFSAIDSDLREGFFIAASAPQSWAEAAGDVLQDPASIDAWDRLIKMLPDLESPIQQSLFAIFTADLLESLKSVNRAMFNRAVMTMAEWAARTHFEFGYCDVIADRFESIYPLLATTSQKVAICKALMELGTTHNRWHVMRTVRSLIWGGDEGVVDRLALEARNDRYVAAHFRNFDEQIGNGTLSLWPDQIANALMAEGRERDE